MPWNKPNTTPAGQEIEYPQDMLKIKIAAIDKIWATGSRFSINEILKTAVPNKMTRLTVSDCSNTLRLGRVFINIDALLKTM